MDNQRRELTAIESALAADVARLTQENERLRDALLPMTRGACLQQIASNKCVCYTCIARAALKVTP